MNQLLFSVINLTLIFSSVWGSDFNPGSLTKYNVFVKTPKSKEYIHTGGRLIDRHVGYISQAGYKGYLSTVEFATVDTSFNGVPGSFPSTAYEMTIAESYGMKAASIVTSLTVESARQVSNLLDS